MLKNDHRLLGLFAVEDRSVSPNILQFYRVNDAKKQVVTGTFSYVFTSPDEAIVFGSPYGDVSKQVLFIIDPIKIHLINIKKLPGKILSVSASNDTRFMAIVGEGINNKKYICIISKKSPTAERCVFLNEKKTPAGSVVTLSDRPGYWVGNTKSHYVVPQTDDFSTSTVLMYDPYAQNMVATSTDAMVRSHLNTVPYAISSWLGWYKVTSLVGGFSRVVSFPAQWRILQLANGYLLGLGTDKAYLINPKTKQAAFFADLPPVEQRVVSIP
jgi:hypothetical protein